MNTSTTTEPSNTFYGLIENEDFNTSRPNKKRIYNQIDAEQLFFKYKKQKELENKYKHMTLEELREIKIISNTNGRPSSTLTDEKWQKEFNVRKLFITPVPKEIKKLGKGHSRESGYWNEETRGTYDGVTNWQSYCSFINDVLKNIRAGQIDYCYFTYQIIDLLKFHFDDLRTRYCDGYWSIWLEKPEDNNVKK